MKDLVKIQKRNMSDARKRALREAQAAVGRRFDVAAIAWDAPGMSVLKLREAVAETSFPALLRVGVQNFLFDAYQQVPVVYPQLVRVVNSTHRQELYAPLYQTELPDEVLPGEEFQESAIAGLDQMLVNKKWGRMLAFERELVDDDQTGQIMDKATTFGERMRIREEIEAMNALFSNFLADGITPAYTATIGNVAASPGPINAANLKAADIALEQMRDPLGNLMLVNPTHLVHSSKDKFEVATLLNSAYWPSVPSTTAGATGTNYATNPLSGLYQPIRSRFIPSTGLDGVNGAWVLGEPQRGLVMQDRDPLEVLQENSASGMAFTHDVYRFRVRRRFVFGLIEPRFFFRGN